MNVRGIGLIGGGLDPMQSREVLGLETLELDGWLKATGLVTDAEMDRLGDETQKRLTAAFKGQSLSPPLSPEEQTYLRQLRSWPLSRGINSSPL